MALTVTHAHVSAIADDGSDVGSNAWNANHTISGSINLAADVGATILPVANGGTGQGSFASANIAVFNATNTFTAEQDIALGTITSNVKGLSITATWNAAGVTFDAPLFMNVTNTASTAGSLLADLQIGGVSLFRVGVNAGSGGANTDARLAVGNTWVGTVSGGDFFLSNSVTGGSGNSFFYTQRNLGAFVDYNGALGFSGTGGDASATHDAVIFRDAANIIAQARSTNAQTFRVYNTTDGSAGTAPTNYERASLDWTTTSNTFRIMSEKGGTGTIRIIAIDGFSKAGAAANTDIPSGTWALIHDTSGATTKLCYNNGGTLQTVALT